MWVLRQWLVLPSHFPLVLLEARGRKEVQMKEQQQVEEAQGLSGKEQEVPVSREDWKVLGVSRGWRNNNKIIPTEQSGPKKVWR
jgi:hypothetical protein